MALDFPTSPTVGQQYGGYVFDGVKWKVSTTSTAPASVQPTPPTNPTVGDMWFNSTDGTMYFYYNDGNTSQWVESRAPIVANGYYSPNYVINGGFDIWQRGTSFAYSAPTVAYTADRWNITNAGGTGTAGFTISQQSVAGNPAGTQYALRFQRNSGNTATTYGYFAYNIETKDSLRLVNKQITLSFYARAGANYSPTSSILNVRLATGTGIDQSINSTGYTAQVDYIGTAALTTSWQRFSYTTTVGSTATQVGIQLWSQFTGTAGANDYYEITGVQLEEGSAATTFRRNANSIQGELAACQRYYYRHQYEANGVSYNFGITGWGRVSSVGTWFTSIHPVKMRAAPSISLSGTVRHEDYAGATTSIGAVNNNFSTTSNLGLLLNRSSGAWGANTPGMMVFGTGDGYLEYSSEL